MEDHLLHTNEKKYMKYMCIYINKYVSIYLYWNTIYVPRAQFNNKKHLWRAIAYYVARCSVLRGAL